MDHDTIREGAALIIRGLGLELDQDDNLRDTPDRVARAFAEIFAGVENTEEQVKAILDKAFPCDYTQMIVAKDVRAYSMCPHHLLPVRYTICVAYIPTSPGSVLGISKLCRLVEVLARRPVLQEQLMEDITEHLMSIPGCEGAACIGKGEHYCMLMRGVRQSNASIVASSLKGAFLTDATARAEFMQLFRDKE